MTMTISGSGTIGGLVAGGLPDATVLPADLSTGAPSWDSSGNLSFNSGYGSVATAYGCRAWVNFNGTGTVAIRASGNVSSITDNGVGQYTVNLTSAMSDSLYCVSVGFQNLATNTSTATNVYNFSTTTFAVQHIENSAVADTSLLCMSAFR